MLQDLHIQNYAVIENLRLEFHSGLNLLSGETGSGKSIVVDALGLALGARADTDVIRSGADRATVTAVFSHASDPPWRGWLERYGVADGDDQELILRREVHSSGKSRLLANDQPVTLASVKELARLLVEIHGQNEHVALVARDAQLGLVDQFAGTEDKAAEVAGYFQRLSELESELAGLNQNEQERLRTIDLAKFQVQELEKAQIQPGEDAALESERQVLANLEKVRAAASAAYNELYDDEASACSRLAAASRALEDLTRYDSQAEPHLESLRSVRAALDDVAQFARDYLGQLEADPHRLDEINDRLALLERLKRKYGATVEDLLAYQGEAQRRLAALEHADERREKLEQELKRARAEYRQAAESLSTRRRARAREMEKQVRAELAQVGMEKTRFEIRFAASSGGPRGIDDVEFLISPNPGEELRPLQNIASGGELSRLMLALKTAVGQARTGKSGAQPSFVFDEVDAGIGGRVAESVGLRLKRLAHGAQVLSVTHLPQIACFADHHYYVEKVERAGRTLTTVTYLGSTKERTAELARMLSGSHITDAVLKHAAAMLKQGAAETC